jgi:hypothetical protein
MSRRFTVLSHMRNEEALLPAWLAHHKTIFDHGIIVDYCSTDRSLGIIKELCPTWEIRRTRNVWPNGSARFEPSMCDKELKLIETQVDGFKQVLNTTEFLVVTDPNFVDTLVAGIAYATTGYALLGRERCDPASLVEFVSSIACAVRTGGRDRIIHDMKPAPYGIGRHGLRAHPPSKMRRHPKAFVFHACAPFPYSERFMMRALGVKETLPSKAGVSHHFRSREQFEAEASKQMRIANESVVVWDMTPEPDTPEFALHCWRAGAIKSS